MSNVDLNIEKLDKELLSELQRYIDSLEDKKGNLIHVLHKGQHLFGYLPEALQLYIARALDLPAAKVNGVVSFYSYFTQTPNGKYTISVCMGTACFVKGAEDVLNEFLKELNVTKDEMTEDGLFSVKDVRCVGACGLAPVVMVNEKVYGNVNAKDVNAILNEYKEANQNGN